eukprot:TRINITY_DN7281_c0_g2_i3.p1 TRINITY_DN7281_c0_g2~~TRINITY_DN7281_c0_g2_i3.p1  ORF type:complete len:350 (-),score=54.00 TRINITY_DN7281_c0_g2_i3:243-1151(-)
MGFGDLLSQKVEKFLFEESSASTNRKEGLNWERMLRVVVFASVVGIPILHYYYLLLEEFFPGQLPIHIFLKVFCDIFLFTPASILVFFVGIGALEGASLSEIQLQLHQSFLATIKMSLLIWPFASVLNFCLVPVDYRIFFTGCTKQWYQRRVRGVSRGYFRVMEARSLLGWYVYFFTTRPLVTKIFSGAFAMGFGDLLSQKVEKFLFEESSASTNRKGLNWERMLRVVVFASVVGIPILHYYYLLLEEFFPGQLPIHIFLKVFCDIIFLFTPASILVFFVGIGAFFVHTSFDIGIFCRNRCT